MTPGALGSDTGGSIRQPAALTGVVGVKPTYGRVSRYGLVAFASSLDQVGPFASDVRGAARLLEVIAGRDPRDATSVDAPVGHYEAACGRDVRGLRIGVPEEYFAEGLDPEVAASVRAAIDGSSATAAPSGRSSSRTRATRSPRTTSSRPPRPRPTSRASTACASACGSSRRDPISPRCTARRAARASAPR